MGEETCTHENTTEMLICFDHDRHNRYSERRYEVYFREDCQRIFNCYSDHVMTGDEIMQMFVDYRESIIGKVDEIATTAAELYKQIESALLEATPKPRK